MKGFPLLSPCLKPSFSLRRQLLLSFGSTASVTLVTITVVACVIVYLSGQIVVEYSDEILGEQLTNKLSNNSRYVATTLSDYMDNLEKMVQLTVELVQERIVNYPLDGWEDDLFVPFLDMDSGAQKYPLKSKLLPLDWEVVANVDETNLDEHFQERAKWAKSFFPVSSLPAYFFQGVCNPKETNVSSHHFYDNCTDANNDWKTGGVVAPTPTSKGLYEKAADIGVLLKPIFEANEDLFLVGVYFKNSGAGSFVQYPGPSTNWGAMSHQYVSAGCDWMRKINPHSGKPFGTEEEIARCRPNGTIVYHQEYNPMEREWCQQMALTSDIIYAGPFNHTDNVLQILVMGKAVFDSMTGEFIACVGLSLGSTTMYEIMKNSTIHWSADVSIISYSDHKVFADTLSGTASANSLVTETGFISEEQLAELLAFLDFKNASALPGSVMKCTETSSYYSAYPIPPPPVPYDNEYRPEFIVIQRVTNDVFSAIVQLNDDIRDQVLKVCIIAVFVGALGLSVVGFTLWLVTRGLTEPLQWIKNVAWSIINHKDGLSDNLLKLSEENPPTFLLQCVPRTDIMDLVFEFRSMVAGFSGDGAASVAHPDMFEILNQLTWQSDFQNLYSFSADVMVRKSVRLGPSVDVSEEVSDLNLQPIPKVENNETEGQSTDIVSIVPAPSKKNRGRNKRTDLSFEFESQFKNNAEGIVQVHRSSLFLWILFLIVAPLLLTSFAICFIVSYNVDLSVKSWVSKVASHSTGLEVEALKSATRLKAAQARISINSAIRDLHMITRIAGWLLFDGLSRSESFTFVEQAAQECRNFSGDTCPFYKDKVRAACACQWNDSINSLGCFDYGKNDTRYLQHRFFASQRRDYDVATGNRSKAISYGPGVDDKPSTTLWWDDVDELPGSEKGANASGFVTAYDRLRVTSAMAIIDIPLYNYPWKLNHSRQQSMIRIAFEADGMITGYGGCGHHVYASPAFFQSTTQNQAAKYSPELCPMGKYGYDPRCREWYFEGKRLFESRNQSIQVTSPYVIAAENYTAMSATAPIANPASGAFLGLMILNFPPDELQGLLDDIDNPVSFIIAADGANVAVGSQVLPQDYPNYPILNETDAAEKRTNLIEEILSQTAKGQNGTKIFKRRNNGSEETFTLAYEPVRARALLPLDPTDLSRGCSVDYVTIYTVGLAYSKTEFEKPWKTVEAGIDSQLHQLRNVYISIICVALSIFALFACMISFAVTKPVLTLLQIVRLINHHKISENIPALMGGSREVTQVYNSFAKLCRIIRMSNVAYFSGNPKRAYAFISDALRLYQMIDDKKAIGIACNNLGNTLHAMCKDMKHPGDCCRSIPCICIINEAQSHYKEAILIAEQQLDQEIDEERKAEFALQLADRLFNRALFFLLVDGEACAPADALQLGLADLALSRRLTHDLKSFWLDRRLLFAKSSAHFDRLIQRGVGLLQFYDSDDVRTVWDVNDIVEEGDKLLFAAWDQPMSPLFDNMSRVGRLQQLESVAMRLDMCKGRKIHAARLAMRMFAEDEYILESAFMISSDVLLKLMRDPSCDLGSWSTQTKLSAKAHIRKMLRTCRQVNLDVGKCLIFALEVNERFEGDPLFDRVNELCLILYDELHDDDYMGLAAYTTRGDLNVPLTPKLRNSIKQRHYLNVATTSTSERTCPSWPYAAQMVIDSAASMECDTYILLILDGYSWDPFATSTVKNQIDSVNQERETKVHVFILGMDIEEADVKEECQAMCNITKLSRYMDIDLDNVDASFDVISDLIRGRVARGTGVPGIMMEKF